MIFDTHIHENKYSFDSFIDFEKSIVKAKEMGLDGICITNHDNNTLREEIGDFTVIDGLTVIVGAEILTHQGDILVFGLDDIPEEMLDAEELLKLVKLNNGAAIAAHPYRNNNRGLENNLYKVANLLDGIESFNGSTSSHHNLFSYAVATELGIPSFGASDAHETDRIGKYATKFHENIRSYRDFIEAIKSKSLHPVMYKNGRYLDFDYSYEELLIKEKAI